MSDPERYASVPERITWTTGFRVQTDKHVLGVLSTFANFRTGKAARMSIPALTMRAGLKRRTVERAVHRLEADRWIVAHRRHRHATSWDINIERLATHWIGAKLVSDLSATHGGQPVDQSATGGGPERESLVRLSATGGGQPPDLTATYGGQTADLTATGGGPIPCTSVIPCRTDHKEPALRAIDPDTANETTTTTTEAKVPAAEQLTFGPQALRPTVPDPNWRLRFAKTLRAALQESSSRRKGTG